MDSPVDLISSGPTIESKTTSQDAIKILQNFECQVDPNFNNMFSVLEKRAENPPAEKTVNFDLHQHQILADNKYAVENFIQILQDKFFSNPEDSEVKIENLGSSFTGLARQLGVDLCCDFFSQKQNFVCGGETTVLIPQSNLDNNCKGGRNQEIVLSFLISLVEFYMLKLKALEGFKEELNNLSDNTKNNLQAHLEIPNFVFFSLGTDGQDGPTDAAGAVIDRLDILACLENEENLQFAYQCQEENNSYVFFEKFNQRDCLVKSGLTGTNLMDVQGLLFL